MNSDYQYARLSNGIRIIFKQVLSPLSHFGVFINSGSRDELKKEEGIAHFIEHLVFKGTQRRKAYQIINRMEDVGGELNAFTGREETCIYSSFLHNHLERAIELLADITFRPVFPEKEIIKEREVILDEINSYRDNPSDLIFDDFEEILFKGHSLGRNILGKSGTLKKLKQEDFHRFHQRHYYPSGIVLALTANCSFDHFLRIAEKHWEKFPVKKHKPKRKAPVSIVPVRKSVSKKTFQTHFIMGSRAYSRIDSRRTGLVLLNNVLGGPGMNSLLNVAIREKSGLAYHIESHYQPYSDSGFWSLYLGTDPKHFEKSEKIIKQLLNKLIANKIKPQRLKKAKQQILGQIALGLDHNLNEMLSMGKAHLYYDEVDNMEKIKERIESISADQLQEIAQDIFDPAKQSVLIYESRKNGKR